MSDAYTGEIRIFAGIYVPEGWMDCDGQSLSVQTYPALFALIGTAYGGDGVTTFNLPDLRGRLAVCQGQGTGLTKYTMGQKFGVETVTITDATMPPHNHTFNATTNPATTLGPSSTTPPSASNNMTLATAPSGDYLYAVTGQGTPTATPLDDLAVTSAGGGNQAHNNVMPVMPLRYIMCANGIFPQLQ